VFSSGSIVTGNIPAPASDWQFASAWLSVTADESGSNPLLVKERPFSLPSQKTTRQSSPRPFNLLLAEDNLPDAILVREAIKMENLPLEVHIAPDGERAIELLVNAETDPDAPCPDVLLLDINLPRIDGFEVLRRVRASGKFKDVPVIVITSSDSPADRSEAARLGARYFQKPVTYDEFVMIGPLLRQFLEETGVLR
jgi:CheY-like chemotaxis protein